MTTTFDYASKIATMLAAAESYAAQGNEQAAATYWAKASELQLQKQISESELRKAQNEQAPTDEIIVRRARGVEKNSGYIKARRDLLYGLCSIFNVKTTIAHDRSYVTMYGFESDLEFVQQMFHSLALQMHSMMEHDGRGQGRSWRTSYAHGFAYRVVTRLRLIRAQQEHDASDGNVSTALVLRDRSVAVQEDFDRRFAGAKLRSSYKNRSIRDGNGYMSGDAAGSRADLGQRRVQGRRSIEG